MPPKLEMRHLHAVVVLAEEMNFTRAAQILRISQPALSKQITEVEELNRVRLFIREKERIIDLTDAGRAFVEEARTAIFHAERAIHVAHAAHQGIESTLLIGHSHYADQVWISALFAIRLPLYPKLRIRVVTRSAMDLIRGVLAGELHLALVTAAPEDAQLTKVPFARAPLYAALPRSHPAAGKESLALTDLAKDEWILLARNVHPIIHDSVLQTAQFERIAPKDAHDVMTAHQAVHLVAEHVGVAVLTKPVGLRFHEEGVVIRPLSDSSLWFETSLIMRADEKSRAVNEFARFSSAGLRPKSCQRDKWNFHYPLDWSCYSASLSPSGIRSIPEVIGQVDFGGLKLINIRGLYRSH